MGLSNARLSLKNPRRPDVVLNPGSPHLATSIVK
jgi:hypothetical protein